MNDKKLKNVNEKIIKINLMRDGRPNPAQAPELWMSTKELQSEINDIISPNTLWKWLTSLQLVSYCVYRHTAYIFRDDIEIIKKKIEQKLKLGDAK